jgi:hypothetical protein
MKRLILAICAASTLLFACNNEKKADDDTKETTNTSKTEEPWVAIPQDSMMATMMQLAQPGPMHTLISSWSGTWAGETTMWNFEGDTATKSKGTAVSTMIVGGKYQQSRHTGDMGGMPFEGVAIMGYDNVKKEFFSNWIDVFSTGFITFTGQWDDASKTLSMSGSYPDIFRPGKECKMREVVKVIDENTQLMEMYGPDPKTGKEYKMMEMKMTRKK